MTTPRLKPTNLGAPHRGRIKERYNLRAEASELSVVIQTLAVGTLVTYYPENRTAWVLAETAEAWGYVATPAAFEDLGVMADPDSIMLWLTDDEARQFIALQRAAAHAHASLADLIETVRARIGRGT